MPKRKDEKDRKDQRDERRKKDAPGSWSRVEVVERVGEAALRKDLWRVYRAAFETADEYCAQDQVCYDEASFARALEDPEYWKFLAFESTSGAAVGLALMTNNLSKARVAYCNDRYLRRRYPRLTKEGRLYYVTAIAVAPEHQSGAGIWLLSAMVGFLEERGAFVAFDFSESKNASLPGVIQYAARKHHSLTLLREDLDRQVYTVLYGEHQGRPE